MQVCEFMSGGFDQGVTGTVDSSKLSLSFDEFEQRFDVSTSSLKKLFTRGVELGRKASKRTSDEIENAREAVINSCLDSAVKQFG